MEMMNVTVEPGLPLVSQAGLWVDICDVDDVVPGTGVAALVDGEQLAIVRSPDGESFYAISNFDPYSKAFVLSRGIVGDKGGVLKITSPIYKQAFDLKSGVCLDEPRVVLPTYPIRVQHGRVQVRTVDLDQKVPVHVPKDVGADAE